MHFFSQIVFSAVALASLAAVNATPYPYPAVKARAVPSLDATKGIEIPAPTIAPLIARQYHTADYRGDVDPQDSSPFALDVVPAISSASKSQSGNHAQATKTHATTKTHAPPKRQVPSLDINTITAMEKSLTKEVPAVPALPAIP